jgi:hypothetical protein
VSPRILDAVSLVAGIISFSAIVCGLPATAINKDISYEANIAFGLHNHLPFVSCVDPQGLGENSLGTHWDRR